MKTLSIIVLFISFSFSLYSQDRVFETTGNGDIHVMLVDTPGEQGKTLTFIIYNGELVNIYFEKDSGHSNYNYSTNKGRYNGQAVESFSQQQLTWFKEVCVSYSKNFKLWKISKENRGILEGKGWIEKQN